MVATDNDVKLTHAELEAKADELIADCPGIYNDAQLKRKEREFKKRIISRTVITAYNDDNFTEMDNTLIESYIGDIQDAVNRSEISDDDFQLVRMRMVKMTYADIAEAMGIPVMTCYDRLVRAQQAIMSHPSFGHWEEIMSMLSCEQSNWFRMFRELMDAAAEGKQVKIKIK